MSRAFYAVAVACAFFSFCHGAKILAVFTMGAHSHFTLGFRLAKELADRGHQVTFINAYPQKVPIKNLKEISVAEIRRGLDGRCQNYIKLMRGEFTFLRKNFVIAKLQEQ